MTIGKNFNSIYQARKDDKIGFCFIRCILAMGLIFYGLQYYGNITFGFSMAFIVLSLLASVSELLLSTRSLNIELEDMEQR
jgi:hypothetical protein